MLLEIDLTSKDESGQKGHHILALDLTSLVVDI